MSIEEDITKIERILDLFCDLDEDDAEIWVRLGWSPNEVKAWLDLGVTDPYTASALAYLRIPPGHLAKHRERVQRSIESEKK